MTTDGTYMAVVDRFEDDLAVLLLEEEGETVGEAVVDKEQLPQNGQAVDAVLEVQLEEGQVINVSFEEKKTEDRSDEASRRFDNLSQRPPSEEDDEE